MNEIAHTERYLASAPASSPPERSSASIDTAQSLLIENAALKQKLASLEARLAEIRSVSLANRQRDQEAVRKLQRKIADLRQEKRTILSSTSWLASAPFRSISTHLPPVLRHLVRQTIRNLVSGHVTGRLAHEFRRYFVRVAVEHRAAKLSGNDFPGRRTTLRFGNAVDPTIIVPVYNAPDELEKCAHALFRHTKPGVRILFIDDASTDPRVSTLLSRFSTVEGVEVIRNDVNLGFTRTVNVGIEIAGKSDVVLLNSDAIVTPRWLTNLIVAAHSEDRIGTVTPFSNNAGAFSAPDPGHNSIEGVDLDALARLVTQQAEGHYPHVPTGHGFCLYIRRACLDEMGKFDEVAFPWGYGEENDFCLRATRSGWKHLIDDRTIVFHTQAASFGARRTNLLKASSKLLHARYPEYRGAIQTFAGDQLIARCRNIIRNAFERERLGEGRRPRALFVISTTTGGTPQTNADLMSALADRYEPYLLRCDTSEIELHRLVGAHLELVAQFPLAHRVQALPHTSPEYDAIVECLLLVHCIEIVHVRHIAWHSLNFLAVCKKLDLPIVFSFHDFYAVCPTVKLLDDQLTFCGGTCSSSHGECKPELWRDRTLFPLKNNQVKTWQGLMREALSNSDFFVTTSYTTKSIIQKVYPNITDENFAVIPHGRDLAMTPPKVRAPGSPLRILVPGNISDPKGARVIRAIAEMDAGRRFEFHLLGKTTLKPQRGVVLHGDYARSDFADIVEQIAPFIGAVLSIWPETYCHTLTEMWAAGLPVVGFDIGAVGERLRKHGGGWLVNDFTPASVARRLEAIAADKEEYTRQLSQVRTWQKAHGSVNTTARMAAAYDGVYRRVLARRAAG
jgi:GT2 family glycosyltransferase